MATAAVDTWGRLDAVVNNAASRASRSRRWRTPSGTRARRTPQRHQECASRPSCTDGRRTRYAAIINTTSMSGMIGNFGRSNYGAPRQVSTTSLPGPLMGLRKAGVSANCIAPVANPYMTDDIDMVDDAGLLNRSPSSSTSPCSQGCDGKTSVSRSASPPVQCTRTTA